MTKLRAPLSAQLALTRIAGAITWARCAEVTGRSERTVRDWSDPDTSAGITLDAAIAMDIEYRTAGGDGSPLLEWYALKLEVELAQPDSSRGQLLEKIATAAKECGEATAAAITAALASSSTADFIVAERETEESIAAFTRTLSQLRALRLSEAADRPRGACT